jgi:SET domain-containing protein
MIEVRESPIHGKGVFALRPITRGTRIIEYTGERISWEEADRREEKKDENDTHTMLFTVDKKTVIDATRRGSDARFINHACLGNCRSYIDGKRVFIEARRNIQPGEELCYDYKLQMDGEKVTRKLRKMYACRCGKPRCRGTLLYVPREPPPATAKAAAGNVKASAAKRGARRR